MLPSRLWAELTTADFDAGALESAVAVLPVAATEQHGPHLPLGTDTYIAEGYIARVMTRLPADLPAVFLPVQTVGCSLEHSDYPGTLSLSARAALAAWGDLVASVARSGFRKLVIVNSHGGNSSVIDILAHEARASHGLFAVIASWQRFGYPAGLIADAERAHGIHGGQVETALMLAFQPHLVRAAAARAVASASVGLDANKWLRAFGRPTGFGWMAQDLSPGGVVGDAAAATAEIGEACATFGADAFVELLREVHAFDLARLAGRPSSG